MCGTFYGNVPHFFSHFDYLCTDLTNTYLL